VPTKNPFIDNKLCLVCQGGKALVLSGANACDTLE
jgi:hypothetical protein